MASSMMTQYREIKKKYSDTVLFFRLGDFYELFDDDAIKMSKVLELTLTGKNCGENEKAPMCGIPVKAMDLYVKKALSLGYKIAICEQLSEPTKNSKEIVQRDVVRVITSGTIMEDSILDDKKNNYILSIAKSGANYGLAWADITTGELNTTEFSGELANDNLNDALIMISPNEIICNDEFKDSYQDIPVFKQNLLPAPQNYYDYAYGYTRAEEKLKTQLNTVSLKAFGLNSSRYCVMAIGGLLEYLGETQKRALPQINSVKIVSTKNYMQLDYVARKNLELLQNSHDGGKHGSILWLLDNTSTSMGGRLLRKFITEPLQNIKEINMRQNGVEELYKNIIKRESIISELDRFADIERICGKISYGSVNPKECLALCESLQKLPRIKKLLENSSSKVLQSIYDNIDEQTEVVDLLTRAISFQAPSIASEGGIFNEGYSQELDDLKHAKTDGVKWVVNLEAQEREETGIKNLKIDYNRVFGYYIEVTNSQKDLVPFRYTRKQTLTNAERYVTPELKELEDKILGSEEKALKLELSLFGEIKKYLLTQVEKMQNTSRYIAYLDALCSLATVAVKNNYVRPKMVDYNEPMIIKDGRHPIVEKLTSEQFVPNDTLMNSSDSKTMIITGPNMAGKSTYMRQVAVICLLAHTGSFVPASEAQIPLTDRIFTRIGASDDLSYGQSTFMVEMVEVANILHSATEKSLILLDEVGRGTSTFDGLSIAWSVMEYLSKHLNAKTLFSTHYHELTELEGLLEGVKNYRISVKEKDGKVIFLRKIVRGGANRSFGIEVASLAGLPSEIISRARQLLASLEQADINRNLQLKDVEEYASTQETRINQAEIVNMLKEIDINKVSPIEAFTMLADLIEKAKK